MELSMNPNDLVWKNTEYKLKFILDNPNFELPQVVRIHQGHMIDEDDALASGQILTIHGKKKIENVTGQDIYGRELNIPLSCPFKLRVIAMTTPRTFKDIRELCYCESPPSFVSLQQDAVGCDDIELTSDTILELKDKVMTSDGEIAGLNCRVDDQNDNEGRTITLPMHFIGGFTETFSYQQLHKRYIIADLIKEFKLPINVQFLSNTEKNSSYGPHLGLLTLERKRAMNSILATTIIDNVRHALTFSAELPVTIQVATGIKKSPCDWLFGYR